MSKKIFICLISIIVLIQYSSLKSQESTTFLQRTCFSDDEVSRILEDKGDVPMRVLQTTNIKDSLILRSKSTDIIPDKSDNLLHSLIQRMYATLADSATKGVGIAAPQVGILRNIILVQRFDKTGEPIEFYLNPKILQYSQLKQDCREGCLSIPNKMDTTQNRSYSILIKHIDLEGNEKIEMVEGFTAVIFQHEIDHLNGILFTDYLYDKENKK